MRYWEGEAEIWGDLKQQLTQLPYEAFKASNSCILIEIVITVAYIYGWEIPMQGNKIEDFCCVQSDGFSAKP